MANKKIQLKDQNGDLLYPNTYGFEAINGNSFKNIAVAINGSGEPYWRFVKTDGSIIQFRFNLAVLELKVEKYDPSTGSWTIIKSIS